MRWLISALKAWLSRPGHLEDPALRMEGTERDGLAPVWWTP
jgi:hypothetical protein